MTKNVKIKYLGILMFVVGVLTATILAAKLPKDGHTFSDTTNMFCFTVVLSIIGIVIWHLMERKIIKERITNQDKTSDNNPIVIMEKLVPALKELDQRFMSLNLKQVQDEVDKLLDNFIIPFADVRKEIVNILGMSKGSNILITVAYGERMLNRVWSAASDGHLQEAQNVFPEARDALIQAFDQISKK